MSTAGTAFGSGVSSVALISSACGLMKPAVGEFPSYLLHIYYYLLLFTTLSSTQAWRGRFSFHTGCDLTRFSSSHTHTDTVSQITLYRAKSKPTSLRSPLGKGKGWSLQNVF